MMIKKILMILLCSVLWAANLDAFLDNGIGIVGPSMGGANFRPVGLESAWSAPARLSLMQESKMSLVIDRKWDFLDEIWLGAAMPTDFGVVGFQYFNQRSIDQILGTTYVAGKNQLDGLVYNYYESLMQLTYANDFNNNLRWAAAGRLQTKVLGPVQASSMGLDVGGDWDVSPELNLSVKLTNLVSTPYEWASENEQPSLGWISGVGFQLNPMWSVNAGLQSSGSDMKWLLGSEYVFNQSLFIRAGANRDELSAGIGLQLGSMGIDYGFQYVLTGEGLLTSIHRMGVSFAFDGVESKSSIKEADVMVNETATSESPPTEKVSPKEAVSVAADILWSNKKWIVQGFAAAGLSRLAQNDRDIILRADGKFYSKGMYTEAVVLNYDFNNGQRLKMRLKVVNGAMRIEGITDLTSPITINGKLLDVGANGRYLMIEPLNKGEAKIHLSIQD